MKTHTAYEIIWTRCEYGGPSVPAGSTLHRTREAAEIYKDAREGSSADALNSDDPFFYRGSSPQLKVVTKAEYKRIKPSGIQDEVSRAEAAPAPGDGSAARLEADPEGRVILRCPNCAQQLRVPRGKSGTIKCSSCGQPFQAAT